MSNLRIVFICICITVLGCSTNSENTNTNSGTANVNKVTVHAKKHWYTPWRKSEEEWKAEEEEKAKIIAEQKARLKEELAAADGQLDMWVTKLDKRVKGEGFIHHEGTTELDPWGNLLEVKYYQVNLKEFMEIRSFGPDGQQETEDDLVRKKHAVNFPGMFDGLDGTGKLVLFWVCSGILSFFLFSGYVYSGKKRNHHKHTGIGLAGALIYCIVLAPLAAITYGISLISSIGGLDFDLDPFDVDIDIG